MLEAPATRSTRSVRDKWGDNSPLLVGGLPYLSVVDDKTLLLRDGDLMASFIVEGINADTIDSRHTMDLSNTVSRFIAQQRADVAYYVHRISVETHPSMPPITTDPFSAEIDRRWQIYLQTIGLRNRITMVTLVIRPPRKISKLLSLVRGKEVHGREELALRAARLDQMISGFMVSLNDAKPTRLKISDGRWLGFLKTLISGSDAIVIPGQKFLPVADLLASSNVGFQGRVFTYEGTASETRRYGTIVSVKDYPSETYPGIFDRLNLPYDTVVSQSFTPIDPIAAQGKISRVRKQMRAAEDAAVSLMAQLEEAEDDVASGRVTFGDHHCSIAVFCQSLDELENAMSQVNRAMQDAGAAIVRENFAARAVFFAQHPGNFAYRTRPAMISSQNFAQFCAMHGVSKGNPVEKSPWGDSVTILPTARGETFRFNFHIAGGHGQRTVGHSLVLGQTGSGKTLGTAFLLSQAQRLNARTILFDKDNGFEMAVRAMGGYYSAVRMGEDTHFNPMRAESDARGVAWLVDWLSALAQNDGARLTPVQLQALSDAATANATADPRLQNFEEFRSQLRATDDDGDLYTRLGRWDDTGQFSWLFGGKEMDRLAFNNHITAFDLSEIFDNDIVRTAWLSYVFRRIERLVEDEHPTLIVLDEAWKLLDDPYFEARLKDWMLTMRKKNVAVVLLTQRVSHIKNSRAGDAILESAVTRLVYPSSFNTEAELAPLNLTPAESAFLQISNVDNHLVLLKSGNDSVVLDFDLGALGKGLKILGGGRGEKAPTGWRDRPDFQMEMLQ
ncbi:type IV secretion system DNA-binding domain-containing protein [Rhizobium sp. NFACC06-2]|uniref:VirB4 family type IV secretion/conjugal transfer ATPase n=1 Tax=Rhizobium sp. NFACC06-2 TaxID=1566264 RepID=UPI00087749C4|nr:type IV secretion system DNA-binding domain-containing protein [Rhizobium sp. NFACC06-2]SCY90308.1 type IV secretion system protein VirB4 [Rhizobium sp. NFACC06-2]